MTTQPTHIITLEINDVEVSLIIIDGEPKFKSDELLDPARVLAAAETVEDEFLRRAADVNGWIRLARREERAPCERRRWGLLWWLVAFAAGAVLRGLLG